MKIPTQSIMKKKSLHKHPTHVGDLGHVDFFITTHFSYETFLGNSKNTMNYKIDANTSGAFVYNSAYNLLFGQFM